MFNLSQKQIISQKLQAKLDKLQKAITKQKKKDIKKTQQVALLHRRMQLIENSWVVGEYLIVKCGNEIAFCKRTEPNKAPELINMHIEENVWVESIYFTGCDDLIQIFIIDEENLRTYVITWNLAYNRQHSLY